MTTKKTTEIVSEIVELLTPLDPSDRIRAIQASLVLLGENPGAVPRVDRINATGNASTSESDDISSLPQRAQTWIKQNSVSMAELEQVFHFEDGKASFIAGDIPGKNKKDKTYATYVLCGLSQLLSIGNAGFDDKSARALCESLGCYDQANHSSTIKERGNEFTGTKEKGWVLTAPGLKRAAELVKEMTKVQ